MLLEVLGVVGGDFNDVLTSEEKLGGKKISQKKTKILWDYINTCNLIDLGFKDPKFTWSNKRKKKTKISF